VVNDQKRPGPRQAWWLTALMVVGVVLTAGAVVLIVLVAVGTAPIWALALLSVGVWGPITLIVSLVLSRYVTRVKRLKSIGIPVRATVVAINQTASRIGGRPVLRITLSIDVPGRPATVVSIRDAAPYHLVGMLRPGVDLPVVVDPNDPGDPRNAMIDWPAVERESTPG
jgi:hypothetical protein